MRKRKSSLSFTFRLRSRRRFRMDRRFPLIGVVLFLGMLSLLVCYNMQEFLAGEQGNRKSFPPLLNKVRITHNLEDSLGGELSCGEICSYNGTCRMGKYYPLRIKRFSCSSIFKRMANTSITVQYPPPKKPPLAMEKEFTQSGDNPVTQWLYLVEFNPENKKDVHMKYTKDQIDNFIAIDNEGQNINTYDDNGNVASVLTDYKHLIDGRSALVVGTERPWLESMLVNRGARSVMTLEYRDLILEHEKMGAKRPHQMANDMLNNKQELYEVGASFSSIEHSGLGRYGDPVDPYGDLEAMAQVWCQMKPGGIFFLSVPTSSDGSSYIVWNAHRVYGLKRLQHLTANWNVLDLRQGFDAFHHAVLVLEKPTQDLF